MCLACGLLRSVKRRPADHILTLSNSTDPEARWRAARSLREHGALPAAVEALVAALEDPDTWFEEWMDWSGPVGGHDHAVSEMAARTLSDIGAPAVLPLLAAMERGLDGACTLGPQIVMAVPMDALHALSAAEQARLAAVTAPHPGVSARLQEVAQERALDERSRHTARLSHADKAVAQQAAHDLGALGGPASATTLLDVLLRPDLRYAVEESLVKGLLSAGPHLSDAQLRDLVAVMRIPKRLSMTKALLLEGVPKLYGARAEGFKWLLVDFLILDNVPLKASQKSLKRARVSAMHGMRTLYPHLPGIPSRLLAAFTDLSAEHTERSKRIAYALTLDRRSWVVHPQQLAEASLDVLCAALQGPSRERSRRAAERIKLLQKAGASAAPVLISLLTERPVDPARLRQPSLYGAWVWALRDMGPAAAPALPRLLQLLNDPTHGLERQILFTLAGLGAVAAPALPTLDALDSRHAQHAAHAIRRALQAKETS